MERSDDNASHSNVTAQEDAIDQGGIDGMGFNIVSMERNTNQMPAADPSSHAVPLAHYAHPTGPLDESTRVEAGLPAGLSILDTLNSDTLISSTGIGSLEALTRRLDTGSGKSVNVIEYLDPMSPPSHRKNGHSQPRRAGMGRFNDPIEIGLLANHEGSHLFQL